MPQTLVFATNNAHKLQEVRELLPPGFVLKSMDEIGCSDDIPETGATFEENAALKCRHVFQAFRVACFADDSGLEVEALNNEPGVFSARYSGSRDPERNLDLVLERLQGQRNRNACFRTVIALITPAGQEYLFEGTVRGTLRSSRSGEGGFGYDPIFVPEGYELTFSEMTAEAKNRISHRGIAVRKMLRFLATSGLTGS